MLSLSRSDFAVANGLNSRIVIDAELSLRMIRRSEAWFAPGRKTHPSGMSIFFAETGTGREAGSTDAAEEDEQEKLKKEEMRRRTKTAGRTAAAIMFVIRTLAGIYLPE